MLNGLYEPPPTAGLPLLWRDFLPGTASFEQDFAAFLGQPTTQITCSGTAAITVALTALKQLSHRRSVVIPAYTCPLVPLAVLRCGLKPVLCDTKLNHFDFCTTSLKAVCDDDTLAVIPTHLGGRVADLKSITAIAQQVGAYVVEDAAQALGAHWQGQLVGSIGDIGCYSLGVGKGLTIYSGGAIVAKEESIRQLMQAVGAEIAPYNIWHEVQKAIELVGYYALYRPLGLGFAFGYLLRRKLKKNQLIEAVGDDCDASFALHQVGLWRKSIGANALRRLPRFISNTTKQAVRRKSQLAKIANIHVMDDCAGDRGVWPYFLVLMPNQSARDAALAKLWPAKLGVGRLFIHALCDYDFLPLERVNTPNATDFSARTLTITNSPWLSEGDFMKICKVLKQVTLAQAELEKPNA